MTVRQSTVESSHSPEDFSGLMAKLGALIDRHEYAILAFGLVLYFARSLAWSQATAMIPDELLTYVQAQSPTLSALWMTLTTAPITVDPPLNPLLSFFALRLPLPFTLALRIPAILSYAALMLSLFVFVRRRFPPAAALFAFALPMVLPIVSFSIQNRPYALWMAASGWALVCWQSAARESAAGRRRTLSLCGLYVCLTAAVLAQYLGAVIFLPLIVGELWRSRASGRDIPMWLTFAAGGAAVLLYGPFFEAASAYRAHPWHGVVASDLEDSYMLGISAAVLGVLMLAVAVHLFWKKPPEPVADEKGFPSAECAVLTALYFIPAVMFGLAILVTHSYVPRYSVVFSFAAVCFVAVLLFTLTRQIRGVAALLLAILFLRAAAPRRLSLLGQETGGITATLPAPFEKFWHLPIVMPIWDSYLRFYLFGADELKKRMVLVWDPDRLTEFGNNGSLANEAVARAMHSPHARAPEFFQTHHEFLLVGNYALRDRLIDEGWTVAMLGNVYGWDLYLVTAS